MRSRAALTARWCRRSSVLRRSVTSIIHRQVCLLAVHDHEVDRPVYLTHSRRKHHEDRCTRHRHGRPGRRRPAARPRPRVDGRYPRPAGDAGPHRARRHGQPALLRLARRAPRGRGSRPSPRPPSGPSSSSTRPTAASPSRCSNQAGAANLAGKVLLDIANPLDFSQGFPPTLFVKDTDSLGEQIQRAFPDVKVVKALNTMTAAAHGRPRPRSPAATTPSSCRATTRPPRRR